MKTKEWQVLGAVIATGMMGFSGVLIETSMNVTFPHLMQEFHTNASGVQWVTTGYLLAIAVVVPVTAYLIRRFSVRQLFTWSNGVFILGLVLDSFSPTLAILLLGRLAQGIGTGIALPLMFHIILTKSPLAKRGVMMGIGTMTTSIAPAIGPTYGGLLLSTLGWRSIFWFLLLILGFSLVLGLRSIPAEQTHPKETLNWGAFLSLALGLTALLLAIDGQSVWLALVSLLPFTCFILMNRRHPLLNLHIFKLAGFAGMVYAFLVFQAVLLGLSFVLPNYLQLALHVSATTAGLFMFPGAVMGAILAPVSGRLLDRYGYAKPIGFGLVTATLALMVMTWFFPRLSFGGLLLGHVVLMTGVGFAYSNLMTTALGLLPTEDHADGNSVLNTLQQFIGASATAVMAQFLAQAVAKHPVTGVVQGSQNGLMCLTMLILIAVIVFGANLIYLKHKASV